MTPPVILPETLPVTLPVTALILCGGRGSRMGGVDKPLELFHKRPLVQHVLDRIAPQVGGRVVISANRHLDTYAEFGFPVLEDGLSDFQGPLAGLLSGLDHVALSLGGEAGIGDASGIGSRNGTGSDAEPEYGIGSRKASVSGSRSDTGSSHLQSPALLDHWLLCVSGDSPWLPLDLLSRLAAAIPALSVAAARPSLHGSLHGALRGSPDSLPVPDSAMAWGREAPDAPLRSQPLASLIHTRHRHALSDALARGERRVEAWLRTLPLAEVAFDRPEDANAFANINDRSQLERHPSAP